MSAALRLCGLLLLTLSTVHGKPDVLQRAKAKAERVKEEVRGVGAATRALYQDTVNALPVGQIDHEKINRVPKVEDPRFGESGGLPLSLSIVVDRKSPGPINAIGELVDERIFAGPEYPRFVFNVVFACSKPDVRGKSHYADPTSIWHNVFFGYYQLDAPTSAWSRPFGYTAATGRPELRFEDLVRIGKADWNYFSNRMYGVPDAAIRPLDPVDLATVKTVYRGRKKVGARWWDSVEISGIKVVSPYKAAGDRDYEDFDPVLSPLWRRTFGVHPPRPGFPKSFFVTSVKAELFISYRTRHNTKLGERAHETLIFGGTINEDHANAADNQRFLDLQMASLRAIMVTSGGGFAEP
jgi:hypothetical protein